MQINFKNKIFSKNELNDVIYKTFTNFSITRASSLADDFKELGFKFATKAGISLSIEDLKVPPTKKALLLKTTHELTKSDFAYLRGEITFVERFQKIVNTWNTTSETLKNDLINYFKQTDPLNTVYLMAFSGARGNMSQVRQLVGMRGLMSDPKGQIIDIPIIANFREGLTVTDYIISAYGARKGVVDTALKTADSGYLTRRLIEVAQEVVIRQLDCRTKRYINLYIKEYEKSYFEKIIGRTIAQDIFIKKNIIIKKNEQINHNVVQLLKEHQIYNIKIRSTLTCDSNRSICQKCYGWDLSKGKVVKLGEAVGIIAAQSIGEPGTQLTMRTFHTGGIFTSDSSLQIRAKETGVFLFKNQVQTHASRTIYGQKINILEKESYFYISNYQNVEHKIKLPANSSLFLKNKSFIKKNDLIAELPLNNQQTVKSKKDIIAPHSGEIKIIENSQIVWILKGEVYNLFNNSLLNKLNLTKSITTFDNLTYFKIVAKKDGILTFKKNLVTSQITDIKIKKHLRVFNFQVFWDEHFKLFIFEKKKKYYILNINKQVPSKNIIFATYLTKNYKTELGGQLFYPKHGELKNNKILFVPIETHIINKSLSVLLVPNNTKLEFIATELVPGIFSKTNGFLQIKEYQQILEEIQIKPCKLYEYLNLNKKDLIGLKEINKKIYFPGEIIFEDILIESFSLIEVIKIKTIYSILVRPVYEFNLPKSANFLKESFIKKEKSNLNFLTLVTDGLDLQNYKKEPINIAKSVIEFKNNKLQQLKALKLYTLKHFEFKNFSNLVLMAEYPINLDNFIPERLISEELKISLAFKYLNNVEKNDLIAKVATTLNTHLKIISLKKYNNRNNVKNLLVSDQDYKDYLTEESSYMHKPNQMLHVGDKIKPLVTVNVCGKIVEKNPFKIILHKATPFFLTSETKLYKKSGNLIIKSDCLGYISFKQIITGDIIQGLPKVEEILEVRKPQNPAILNETPGIIFKILKKSLLKSKKLFLKIELIENHVDTEINLKKHIQIARLENNTSFIIKKRDYVYLGQALTNGSINAHNLLNIYFNYFIKKFNNCFAADISIQKIQLLLIQKIQQIYNSQGVYISDKHLEIIVKKITSKVKISEYQTLFLLPGEVIEFKQIKQINEALKKSMKVLVRFTPILVGITKVSLMSESFIAASSFQQTTKILTAAAIEGKIDWLGGLKENVILGRLIPAGIRYNSIFNF
jgi:DNA-directed RNA polymerase subunit beta'